MKKYNAIVATDIGTFIINKNDIGVGWQLSEYGTYDPFELQAIKEVLRALRTQTPNLIVLDIGANIGIHSVVLSQEVGAGSIYAFEAQRIIFNMLAGNIAINSISNVFCFHHAVSNVSELLDIPKFDYGKPMSFGSIEFGGDQKEDIGQKPQSGPQENVTSVVIDELGFHQINFIKIDVEGMEIKVLEGCQKSILRFRPTLLIEYLKSEKAEIISFLRKFKYRIYSGVGANYLCIPEESNISFTDLTLI
jgi:FkbM family methyltransferase